MGEELIYDIIGIGIGPFNLGLAAILLDIPELVALFIDQQPSFDWHPGLLLPTARMQVPYYADLVTIVNPQSRFTFHQFLHDKKRFFRFANQENNYPLRKEYNEYCQWVAGQLPNLNFNCSCESISYNQSSRIYAVQTSKGVFHAKHIVLGTGTEAFVPSTLQKLKQDEVIHSGKYLFSKSQLLTKKKITIIGSGQSAAEIFMDLLAHADELETLSWITQSNRFHPMDVSRFTAEMTSMDYIDHFYSLHPEIKRIVLLEQQHLYKGINASLIEQINESLYVRFINGSPENVYIQANQELSGATIVTNGGMLLTFKHRETSEVRTHLTDTVIAATGYHYQSPACIENLRSCINWTPDGRYWVGRDYAIDKNHTIFVQNAETHSHGFNAADLAMGPYRNATIINTILGKERFSFEQKTGFQTFDTPC